MRDEIARFVASLAIPADRKAIVLAELTDHAASAMEAAAREGRDPEAAAQAALGDLAALRRALEAVEPGFRVPRARAIAHGVVGGLAIALLLDRGGSIMHGVLGALAVLAILVACAPARTLDRLRAELRAARGAPVGSGAAYVVAAMATPYVVWIALIIARGDARFTTPWPAFVPIAAGWALLAVEAVRARRRAEA